MGDVEPRRPLSRLLFIAYIFGTMGLMLTLAGECTACRFYTVLGMLRLPLLSA